MSLYFLHFKMDVLKVIAGWNFPVYLYYYLQNLQMFAIKNTKMYMYSPNVKSFMKKT